MTALEKGERSGINQDGVDWGYVTVRAGLMQEGSGRGWARVGSTDSSRSGKPAGQLGSLTPRTPQPHARSIAGSASEEGGPHPELGVLTQVEMMQVPWKEPC